MQRIGELFCCAGGFAAGADIAAERMNIRVRHSWATDYSPVACESYKTNFPCAEVICADVREVDFSALDDVDGLTFGFPCNSFSEIGKRDGTESNAYGNLYLECTRALNEVRPTWFIAENVKNLKHWNGGSAYRIIKKSFKSAGYTVRAKILKFEYLGVPQARHRVVFVGFRDDVVLAEDFAWPTYSKWPEPCAPHLLGIDEDDYLHEMSIPNDLTARVIASIGAGQGYADCLDSIPLDHRPAYLAKAKKGEATIFSTYYRRIHPELPCRTIVAHGGGGHKLHHYPENRELTMRELMRLQTFPDSHLLSGNRKEELRSQIGMAVPPIGISRVYEAVWKALGVCQTPQAHRRRAYRRP